MQGKLYSSEGIIIGIKNFSEADKIITVYSPKLGKLRLIAKGVAKPKSRKRGHLDNFNKIRFSASASSTFDVMTEVELISDPQIIKKDLKKASVAYFMLETVNRLNQDDEPNPGLYTLLDNYLERLSKSNKTKQLRMEFIKDVLVNLGFWPANRKLVNADEMLSEVTERAMHTTRVGKKLLE